MTVGVVWVLDGSISGLGYVVCFWVPVSRGWCAVDSCLMVLIWVGRVWWFWYFWRL